MANNIRILITAEDKASKPIRQLSGELDNTSKSGDRFASVMKGAGRVAFGALTAGAVAATTGLVAASKASYDQVKAVEEARFGLMAYEKDAGKVEKVLGDLVSYAKSDMGVLFNRKDMFAAASTLKMYGNETDSLADRVKILSKGVAQGKTSFQELSAIVGRAAAKGRLDAVDFDMLIERGIGLDREFRGAAVSADELWTALNEALPDKLLAGRADTIEGRMIRLQSVFRGVGDQVLGVDSKTSNFIKGGLGDRFLSGVQGATDVLKQMAPVVGNLTSGFLDFADKGIATAEPMVSRISRSLTGDLVPAIKRVVSSDLVRWTGTLLVGALHAASWAVSTTITAVSGLLNFMTDHGPIIAGVVASIAAYKAAVIGVNVVTTAQSALVLLTGTRYMMLNGTLVAVRTATVAQTIAQTALNTAMKLNPIGLVVAGAAAIVTAYMMAKAQTDNTKSATDRLNAARREEARAADAAKDANNRLKDAHLSAEGSALAVEGAQRAYNDAVRMYGPDSYEARQAAYQLKRAEDELKTANDGVRVATEQKQKKEQEVADKREATKKAEQEKKAAIERTKNETYRQRDALTSLGISLDQLNGRSISYSVTGNVYNKEWAKQQGYASGAPYKNAQGTNYSPGGMTLVGERGPELVNLPRGSQVMQAYRTRQTLSDGVAGGDTNINITGTININTPEAADAFWNRVDKTQRLAKVGMA